MFMPKKNPLLRLAWSSAVALSSLAAFSPAIASQGIFLPSGLTITPTAAPKSTYDALNPELPEFPNFIAGGALSTAKSPDGKILLVLTGGHNNLTDAKGNPVNTNEYIFVFDIGAGKPVRNRSFRSRMLLSESPLIRLVRPFTSRAVATIISTRLPFKTVNGLSRVLRSNSVTAPASRSFLVICRELPAGSTLRKTAKR
jgi:hypothetical protein